MTPQNAFEEALKNGDIDGIFKSIEDGADPSHESIVECVKLLIPESDPKEDESYALRWALEEGQVQCVRLLLPVSDIDAARARLERDKSITAISLLDSVIQEYSLRKNHSKPVSERGRSGL